MSEMLDKIKERLEKYDVSTRFEYGNELREVIQELILAGLSQTDFFENASFHGGTSLRLIHNIDRYSEDLDFTLEKTNKEYSWKPYLENVQNYGRQHGISLEMSEKAKEYSSVKKAFIKDSSIEQIMNMPWLRKSGSPEKVRIKLEIDTNPPEYARCKITQRSFPVEHNIKIQDLPSLFAGKCHALLCREYEKGRDWYDLKWFINKGVEPNYKYLSSMLNQQGPWKDENITVNKNWLVNKLKEKIPVVNYERINEDIDNFIKPGSVLAVDKDILLKLLNKFNDYDSDESMEI